MAGLTSLWKILLFIPLILGWNMTRHSFTVSPFHAVGYPFSHVKTDRTCEKGDVYLFYVWFQSPRPPPLSSCSWAQTCWLTHWSGSLSAPAPFDHRRPWRTSQTSSACAADCRRSSAGRHAENDITWILQMSRCECVSCLYLDLCISSSQECNA